MCLALTLKLNFAEIVFKALDLEAKFVVFSLKNSSHVPFFFNILGVLNEEFVLVDLKLIPFLSKFN